MSRSKRVLLSARVAWSRHSRPRSPRTALVLAALAASLWPAAAARAETVGGVEVNALPSVTTRSGYGTTHGYVEHRVQLKNTTTGERIVHLQFPAREFGDRAITVTRTVTVAAGQEVTTTLYQPPFETSGDGLAIRVEGVRDPAIVPLTSSYTGRYENSYRLAVLVSRSVPGMDESGAAASSGMTRAGPGMPGTIVSHGPEGPVTFLSSERSVAQWSPNWLAYSCYDAVVVTQEDVKGMPPPVHAALRRYVESGGNLHILGDAIPSVFSQGGQAMDQGFLLGFGEVKRGDSSDMNRGKLVDQLGARRLGRQGSTQPPRDLDHRLVQKTPVPVRGLYVLVLLFTIGIGPVNVWLLARFKRRIWLWWNVPAISLLTCLAVFAYAVFAEGWSGYGKSISLTVLDERAHHATTLGYFSLYCPLTPGPLRLSANTEVVPLDRGGGDDVGFGPYGPRGYSRSRERSKSHRQIDWTNQQELVAGWVEPRVPAYFQVRKSEERRERLNLQRKADGSLAVTNALGADIQQLVLADARGRRFEARDIPAGAERTLQPAGRGTTTTLQQLQNTLRGVFVQSEYLSTLSNYEKRCGEGLLAPGTYVAVLSGSPFLESPLESLRSYESATVVVGISKEQDDGR